MKFTLAITLAILVGAAIIGWRNHDKLDIATRAYEEIRQQARARGITADAANPQRVRSHPSRQLNVRSLATDLIAFAKELNSLPEPTDASSANEREQRMLDWQRRLLALDPAAMKSLIEEINAAGGVEEDSRQDLLFLVLQTLAESHPQAALEILADFPDLLKDPDARGNAAIIALLHGMETDPAAAMAWCENHRDLFPGQTGVSVTSRLLRGIALANPKLAFQLIGELEITDERYVPGMAINRVLDSTQRKNTLAAFREYLTTVQDPARREAIAFEGVSTMITDAFLDGFDKGILAVGNGGFTPEEIETYAGRFSFRTDESGKWIDWLVTNLPTDNVISKVVPKFVSDWAGADYQAAGEWLAATPDGPAKTAATATYASTLAPYHPATAAQWALTLPPGEARDRILPQIYQSWSKTDPSAATAFAKQNGIAR